MNRLSFLYRKMKTKKRVITAIFNGVASTTDLFGVLFLNECDRLTQRTDLEAMRGDWVAVGGDLAIAMKKYVEETPAVSSSGK